MPRPALRGYNHNIRYRNRVYHVQTEDSGLENPHVFTHLYFGGVIVGSAKTTYDDIVHEEGHEPRVQKRMQEQHKSLMKRLRKGDFDQDIITFLGTLDGEEENAAVEAPVAAAKVSAAEAPAAEPVETAEPDTPIAQEAQTPQEVIETEESAPATIEISTAGLNEALAEAEARDEQAKTSADTQAVTAQVAPTDDNAIDLNQTIESSLEFFVGAQGDASSQGPSFMAQTEPLATEVESGAPTHQIKSEDSTDVYLNSMRVENGQGESEDERDQPGLNFKLKVGSKNAANSATAVGRSSSKNAPPKAPDAAPPKAPPAAPPKAPPAAPPKAPDVQSSPRTIEASTPQRYTAPSVHSKTRERRQTGAYQAAKATPNTQSPRPAAQRVQRAPSASSRSGAVVARPAISVGASSSPNAVALNRPKRRTGVSVGVKGPRVPVAPRREDVEMNESSPSASKSRSMPNLFGSELISERSLDEVILHYLAEDKGKSE